MYFPYNNIMLTLQPEFNLLCRPLLDNTAIFYVDFNRFYYDGHVICLNALNSNMVYTYLSQDAYPSLTEIYHYTSASPYLFLSEGCYRQQSGVIQERWLRNESIMESFGVHNRLYLSYTTSQYVEAFGLSCHPIIDNPLEYCIGNLHKINAFIYPLRQQLEPILAACAKQRLKMSDYFLQGAETVLSLLAPPDSLRSQLTPKELICIEKWVKGHSAKQVARELGISYRTVETHIGNVKEKVGIHSKAQLVALWELGSK